jgi:hypothetical protein
VVVWVRLWLGLRLGWHRLLVVEVLQDVLFDRAQHCRGWRRVVYRGGGVSTSAAVFGGGWDGVVVWVGLWLGLWLGWHGLLVVEVI